MGSRFCPEHKTLSEFYAYTLIYASSPNLPDDLTQEQLERCKARLRAVYMKMLSLERLLDANPEKYSRVCPIECGKARDQLRKAYRTLTRLDRRI